MQKTPARMSRGLPWPGTDNTNPGPSGRDRAAAKGGSSFAIVFIAVERVALAKAGHGPDLTALAILSGQEFADLADRALVGGRAPAAVFAIFSRVEILVAFAVIGPHPSAPGAFG